MELAQCLAKLSTSFHSPFFELPGIEVQATMSPVGRMKLVQKANIKYRTSAVMILIFPDENNQAQTVFIKRTVNEGVHSGQIALPGGAFEADDTNLIQTAIRETAEEIGVELTAKQVLGKLTTLQVPVSAFEIAPVVAYTNVSPQFTLDPIEVDDVITISVSDLMTMEVGKAKFKTAKKITVDAPYYNLNGEKLWGATAMIIAEFLDLLK